MGGGTVTRGPFKLMSASSDGSTEARGEIRRVAVLLEMADGTLVTFYSETGGEVTLTSETQVDRLYWGTDEVRRVMGPTRHSVTVDGFTAYGMTENTPSWTRAALDAAQGVVEP